MKNEMLFYGGILLCVLSIVFAIVLGSWYMIRKIKLDHKLDEEYGKEKDRR